MLPGDAGGDNSGGGAMLDVGAEALFVGRSEAGGGTILGARVKTHGSAGAVSEKKSKAELYALEIGRDKVLRSLGKPQSNLYGKWFS